MAKFVYSPTIVDIFKSLEPLLVSEEGPISPHAQQTLDTVVARLQERDHQIESALLGDLTVNNVAGTVGSVAPAQARQIGWSINAGDFVGTFTDSGRGDSTQDMRVNYDLAFPTDTIVVMVTPVFTLGGTPLGVASRTASDKTGFTLTISSATPATPFGAEVSYISIGF